MAGHVQRLRLGKRDGPSRPGRADRRGGVAESRGRLGHRARCRPGHRDLLVAGSFPQVSSSCSGAVVVGSGTVVVGGPVGGVVAASAGCRESAPSLTLASPAAAPTTTTPLRSNTMSRADNRARDRAPVALVTPCPPVVLTENRPLVTTTRPVERRGWPLVEVVDRTGDDPRTGLFSERLVHRLRGVLDEPEGRAVCILNRTGRLRLLACTQCGALVRCGRCGGAMTQDEKDGPLRCRRGDETRPPVCAVCDSPRLRTLRMGVRRATEELAALTQTEAVEITASSEPGHGDGSPLVVGTEAALHRQSWADLVAFVDIDQHLLAPRFGAGEETLALLARAARLVGAHHGRVLVQTRLPDHEALRAAVQADPAVLAEVERPLRRTLELPPSGRWPPSAARGRRPWPRTSGQPGG